MEEIVYRDISDDVIKEIYDITEEFHDNCINICQCANDTLRLEIYNPWGSDIEFVFSGNVACFVNWEYLLERGDITWWKGRILQDKGRILFATVTDTQNALCWFRGESLQYRWLPKK